MRATSVAVPAATSAQRSTAEGVDAERAGGKPVAHRAATPFLSRGESRPCERECAVGLWPTTMAAVTPSGSARREASTSSGSAP